MRVCGDSRNEGDGMATAAEILDPGGGQPPQKAKRWANIVREDKGGYDKGRRVSKEDRERLKEVFSEEVVISDDRLAEARSKWKNALIGKFLGRRLDLNFVSRVLTRIWQPRGDLEIIPLLEGFIIFRFSNDDDRHRIWTGGPWVVGGSVLALEEWRPDFKPQIDHISHATVWMRLPGLPLEYWDRDILLEIVSRAGTPIEIDACTGTVARGGFARACVEVDLTTPLVPGTTIRSSRGPLFQEFVYEGIGVYCFRCGCVGHKVQHCTKESAMGAKIKVAIVDGFDFVQDFDKAKVPEGSTSSPSQSTPSSRSPPQYMRQDSEITKELYGPWLVVENRRRRKAMTKISQRSASELRSVGKGGGQEIGGGGTAEVRQKANLRRSEVQAEVERPNMGTQTVPVTPSSELRDINPKGNVNELKRLETRSWKIVGKENMPIESVQAIPFQFQGAINSSSLAKPGEMNMSRSSFKGRGGGVTKPVVTKSGGRPIHARQPLLMQDAVLIHGVATKKRRSQPLLAIDFGQSEGDAGGGTDLLDSEMSSERESGKVEEMHSQGAQ